MNKRGLMAPYYLSMAWLGGTFVMFLGVGDVRAVGNLGALTVFIAATLLCFTIGYRASIGRYRGIQIQEPPAEADPQETRQIRLLVGLGALYYLAYGIVYGRQYGVLGIDPVLKAVTDPGGAYLDKFAAAEAIAASSQADPAAQVLTLVAVLSAPLVPFLILYWRRVTGDLKLLSLIGLASYVAFFLSIGTLVGLGNLLIFAIVGLGVRRATGAGGGGRKRKRARGMVLVAVVLSAAFAGYMAYSQGSRAELTGADAEFAPNPIVERIAGTEFAQGVAITAFYPTHGYQGLAYNLDTPFVWTGGRGSSIALDGYLAQYGLAESVAEQTYPARTEARVGWSSTVYWATIYPWLASDLTFYGAALFMGVVGWWLARWWVEAVAYRSRIAMLLLGQVALLIAFVPANNQIGLSRPNLITAVVLVGIYALGRRPGPVPQSRKRGRESAAWARHAADLAQKPQA